jgi:hypothetical protein
MVHVHEIMLRAKQHIGKAALNPVVRTKLPASARSSPSRV